MICDSPGINSIIKTYKDTGHEHPEAIKNEIVEFFRDVLKFMRVRPDEPVGQVPYDIKNKQF